MTSRLKQLPDGFYTVQDYKHPGKALSAEELRQVRREIAAPIRSKDCKVCGSIKDGDPKPPPTTKK